MCKFLTSKVWSSVKSSHMILMIFESQKFRFFTSKSDIFWCFFYMTLKWQFLSCALFKTLINFVYPLPRVTG